MAVRAALTDGIKVATGVRAGGLPDAPQAASIKLRHNTLIKVVFMILSYPSQAAGDFISKT
jgi:hypothetical protein